MGPWDSGFRAALGGTLVATMLGLGLLEHVFLAVPLPDAMLWRWVIRGDAPTAGAAVPTAPLCAKKG